MKLLRVLLLTTVSFLFYNLIKPAAAPKKASETIRYLLAYKDESPDTKVKGWRLLFGVPNGGSEFRQLEETNNFQGNLEQTYNQYAFNNLKLKNKKVLMYKGDKLLIIPVNDFIRGQTLADAFAAARTENLSTPIVNFAWLPVAIFQGKDKSKIKHPWGNIPYNVNLLKLLDENWKEIQATLEGQNIKAAVKKSQ